MEILVTGASGFIGRQLVRQLAGRHRVYALARSPQPPLPDVQWIAADLTTPDFESILPPSADAVVALAQSRHYRDFPDRALDVFEVNTRSLLRLLEWGRRRRIGRFLYASSANVYAMGPAPIIETDPLEPQTFYARTKLMGEMLVQGFSDDFSTVVFRLFTAYGPGQSGMLFPQLIDRILRRQAVRIEGEEGLRLSPVYVSDLCNVFEAALEPDKVWPRHEVLNVGGEQRVTILGLAELIGQVLGRRVAFEFVPGPATRGWVADCRRLHAHLKLPRFVDLTEGLRRTVHASLPVAAA